jgi:hypothetical protein
MGEKGDGGEPTAAAVAPTTSPATTPTRMVVRETSSTPTPKGIKRRFIDDQNLRGLLALGFLLLLTLTVVLSFFRTSTAGWKDTTQWLQLMLPAETALLGSATGFYFGNRSKSD